MSALERRSYRAPDDFRRQYPAAKAFLAPQREHEAPPREQRVRQARGRALRVIVKMRRKRERGELTPRQMERLVHAVEAVAVAEKWLALDPYEKAATDPQRLRLSREERDRAVRRMWSDSGIEVPR